MALSKVSRFLTIDEIKNLKDDDIDELIIKDSLCAGD
jgi:hypothetical protein